MSLEGLSSPTFPNNGWFEDKIASWEGVRFGYRCLFEVIGDPRSFKETLNSAGDDEIVELHEPTEGHRLRLTYLNPDGSIDETREQTTLDASSPTVIIPGHTKYVMDATEPLDNDLAYTCICLGEKPLVEQ